MCVFVDVGVGVCGCVGVCVYVCMCARASLSVCLKPYMSLEKILNGFKSEHFPFLFCSCVYDMLNGFFIK
jgi:hypothetical protein